MTLMCVFVRVGMCHVCADLPKVHLPFSVLCLRACNSLQWQQSSQAVNAHLDNALLSPEPAGSRTLGLPCSQASHRAYLGRWTQRLRQEQVLSAHVQTCLAQMGLIWSLFLIRLWLRSRLYQSEFPAHTHTHRPMKHTQHRASIC